VDLIRQAAVGLHHAHLRGVVHRDVKPSNLLVTNSNGNPSQLRIIDFGVARRLSLDAAAEAVTEPGLLVGTLVYMSPEQLAGRPANAASDIYALGLVLYETIEGRPAHGSVPGGLGELLRRTEQPVRERISGCEGHERDLQAIIAKATDPEPARRYPSAQHMADDLERVLSGKPVLARRQTFAYLASRYIRRHPIVSAVLVAALLALSGLVTAVVISRDRLAFEVRDQRELLRALIDESLEQLSVTSGTSESRAAMVRSLRVRTDRLLAQSPSNVDLLRSKARLLREEGDLDSSAGRFAAAEALFLESGEIYHSIYNSDGDVRSGRMWAESLVRRGDARDAQEDRDAARAMYAEAHSIFVELRDMNPKDIVALDDLCWSFDRLAAVDYGADRHVESLGLLEERWRLSETLMKASPDRVLSRFNRAVGALRLARHFAHLGHDDEAFLWAERAGPDIEAVVASQPDRTPFVVWFNEWVTMTSQALEHRGDREGAIRRVRTSLDVASTLWSRAHGDWHALWVALRVHYTGYENLERWGQHDDAVEALREAVRIVESAPGGRRSQAIIRLESLILESARMRGLIPAATE
jgi:tetratricopeptide (TPR) repeat protein